MYIQVILWLSRFTAGDVVSMRPCNNPEDVEQFCQQLRLDPDSQFILKANDSSAGACCPEKK